jgi:hypothetical protein
MMAGLLIPREFAPLDLGTSIPKTYFGPSKIFGKLFDLAPEVALI